MVIVSAGDDSNGRDQNTLPDTKLVVGVELQLPEMATKYRPISLTTDKISTVLLRSVQKQLQGIFVFPQFWASSRPC